MGNQPSLQTPVPAPPVSLFTLLREEHSGREDYILKLLPRLYYESLSNVDLRVFFCTINSKFLESEGCVKKELAKSKGGQVYLLAHEKKKLCSQITPVLTSNSTWNNHPRHTERMFFP
jgi:hypothetical protein